MKKYCVVFNIAAVLFANSIYAATTTPQQAVKAFETKFGINKGMRRNHTKGMCFAANFKASKIASSYTKSEIFNGSNVQVIGRFSHAGGNAGIKDPDGKVFGMALAMKGSKEIHKMAMLNLPFFPVATPEDFVTRLKLSTTGQGDEQARQAQLALFNESRPSIGKLTAILAARNNHYTDFSDHYYNSIHTFYFVDKNNKKTPARWYFYPSGSNKAENNNVEKKIANDFTQSIKNRLAAAPITFDMIVTLPFFSDDLTDPTDQWVTDGQRINFGTLTIASLDADCDGINYDPNVLSTGVLPSNDAILQFRSGAYAISYGKRMSEQH